MADLIFTGVTMFLFGTALFCGGLWLEHLIRRDEREADRRQAAVPVTPTGSEPIHR